MKITRLLVALLIVALLGAGLVALALRSMRTAPDWYVERAAAAAGKPEEPEPEPGGLFAVLGGLLGIETRHASSLMEQLGELATSGRVELDEVRLGAVLETSMSAHADGRAILAALERPLARIDGDAIEFGGTIRLDGIDAGAMTEAGAASLEQLRAWLPALSDRPVYIGVRAVPRGVDGVLRLSDEATLVLGELGVPAWLLPLGDARDRLDLDLRAVGLTRAEVVDGRLVLEAGPPR